MVTYRKSAGVTNSSVARMPARRVPDDPNIKAAGLLYDMSALQTSQHSRFGYKRAARAIAGLPACVLDLVERGVLKEVSFIGPASARILTEFAVEGHSVTVDRALGASPRRAEVLRQRRLRENFLSQYGMEQALSLGASESVVVPSGLRGDFQMHSTWSDGAEAIRTMADACLERGYACMGVTDHSHGLPIAAGMSMAAAREQGREIDRLNVEYAGRFRVFKGVEANIRADGSLDLDADERQLFEYVVASPHALLRRVEDQTPRMLSAVRTPGVAILGHPRGRMYNSRAGIQADWPLVFEAAAEGQVAIELDGNWHRQDMDWELAAKALELGCIFALNSDAHSVGELGFVQFAVAHARLAEIPSARVINCWPTDRLEQWLHTIRGRNFTGGQEP